MLFDFSLNIGWSNYFPCYYQTGECTYLVNSQSERGVTYTIDMKVGVCTCHEGRNGWPCKHQEAIHRHFNVPSSNFLPTTAGERAVLLKINLQLCDKLTHPPSFLQLLSSVGKQEEEDLMKASLTRTRPTRVDQGKRAAAHNRVEALFQISQVSIPSESTPPKQTPPRLHGNTSEEICSKCGEVGYISRICNSPAAPEIINKKLNQFILGK